MGVFTEGATIPLTYRAICAASGKGGGPVATAALVLLALHHELPHANTYWRGRAWVSCDPFVLESLVPLDRKDLTAALEHLRQRKLITVREFPHPDPEMHTMFGGYWMCALTTKATRALAPNKWGYTRVNKERVEA